VRVCRWFAAVGAISGEEALAALATALTADACSGEAWFRLAIIQLAMTEDLAAQTGAMLTGATLLRYATGAWINALIAAGTDDEQHALDILHYLERIPGPAERLATCRPLRMAASPGGSRGGRRREGRRTRARRS
jgi:hypothetical protein